MKISSADVELFHGHKCMGSMTLIVLHGEVTISLSCFYMRLYYIRIYRVSQEECEILRESVPYVKLYRYNPKHLYPKLNGYGVNGHRKVWASVVSMNCTPSVTPYSSTVQARQGDIVMQWPWWKLCSTIALTSQDYERSGDLHKVLRSLRTAETWMREFL